MLGKDIYDTIFKRITDGHCPVSNCRWDITAGCLESSSSPRFTSDRSQQNASSAIIFHMPNLHWENYTYPSYRSLPPEVKGHKLCQTLSKT